MPVESSVSTVGRALRDLRSRRGATIAEVAAATGLSTGFISLVETGKSDISVGRLIRLVSYYGVGVGDVVVRAGRAGLEIVRADERPRMAMPAEGADYLLLAADTHRRMMPLLVEYAPGGGNLEPAAHDGEEFVFVLEGRLTVRVEGAEPAVLDPGDSAYFPSERAHGYANRGTETTRALFVVTPPSLSSASFDARG